MVRSGQDQAAESEWRSTTPNTFLFQSLESVILSVNQSKAGRKNNSEHKQKETGRKKQALRTRSLFSPPSLTAAAAAVVPETQKLSRLPDGRS